MQWTPPLLAHNAAKVEIRSLLIAFVSPFRYFTDLLWGRCYFPSDKFVTQRLTGNEQTLMKRYPIDYTTEEPVRTLVYTKSKPKKNIKAIQKYYGLVFIAVGNECHSLPKTSKTDSFKRQYLKHLQVNICYSMLWIQSGSVTGFCIQEYIYIFL